MMLASNVSELMRGLFSVVTSTFESLTLRSERQMLSNLHVLDRVISLRCGPWSYGSIADIEEDAPASLQLASTNF